MGYQEIVPPLTAFLTTALTFYRRAIEQFTVRDPEDEIRQLDSIQDMNEVSNGHGHASVILPLESVQGRLMIEDGSAERIARTHSGRL